jgi:hypothetical protein
MELTRTIGTLKEGDPRYRELRDKISEAPFFEKELGFAQLVGKPE